MPMCDQIVNTNKPTPNFLQTACPSYHPTNSVKALKRKYHIPGHAHPKLTLGLPALSVTTKRLLVTLVECYYAYRHLSDASTQSQSTYAKK